MWIPPLQSSFFDRWLGSTRIMQTNPVGRILLIDDASDILQDLSRTILASGHIITFCETKTALFNEIIRHPPDLIVLNAGLTQVNPCSLCALLKQNPATWNFPIIIVDNNGDQQARLQAIEAGADEYLVMPIDYAEFEFLIRKHLRNQQRKQHYENTEAVVFALVNTVAAKDSYTGDHLQRLEQYVVSIGQLMGLSENELLALRYGARLHDIGKIGIDEMILRKAGPLTHEEYIQIQQHPLIGEEIIKPLRLAPLIGPIVRHHHERWDGSGYPDRLIGPDIPLGARIVAIADAFDAMTTQRPYNEPLSFDQAIERLREGAGRNWDPEITHLFIEFLQQHFSRAE
jgi:putative two-component system response regulator